MLAFYPVARVQYRELRTKAKLEAELRAITTRNERLSAQVASLKTPAGIAHEASSRLGLVKAGESMAVIVDGSQQPTDVLPPRVDTDNIQPKVAGPWTAFLDVFFGVTTQ